MEAVKHTKSKRLRKMYPRAERHFGFDYREFVDGIVVYCNADPRDRVRVGVIPIAEIRAYLRRVDAQTRGNGDDAT